MVLKFKQIRPSKLKLDEVRLELLSAVNKAAREVKRDFEKTTETWNEKPKFETIISLKDGASFLVGTDSELYRLINDGAKPHKIPKNGNIGPNGMTFPGTFTPKTVPGVIGSKSGGKSGKIITVKKVINHPGHEARNFESKISAIWDSKFKTRIEQAMRRGVAKSKHKV